MVWIKRFFPKYISASSIDSTCLRRAKIAELQSRVTDVDALLDEFRYCKHIYALKFAEGVFPPEPSDFPVGINAMTTWEQKLVDQTELEQTEAKAALMTRGSLSKMDVPPYNCQSPMMMPMMQKLFNIPSNLIIMENFVMIDKDGIEYVPSLDGSPST